MGAGRSFFKWGGILDFSRESQKDFSKGGSKAVKFNFIYLTLRK